MNNVLKKLLLLAVFAVVFAPFSADAQEAGKNQSGGVIKGTLEFPWNEHHETLVYVDRVEGEFAPPMKNPRIKIKLLVFEPHVLPVLRGTTVDLANDDNVAHNISSPSGSPTYFNLGLFGAGVTKPVTFDNFGEVPVLCSVHPEMYAFVIVLQNPYFAFADKAGNFEIKDVPPGTYNLKVWNEKTREASQSVVVKKGMPVNVEFTDLKRR